MKPAVDPLDRAGSQAILIGTASYADPRFPARPAATTSLHAMNRMLVDARLGGWRYDQVTTIEDPSDCRRLAQDIRRIAKGTTGALLVYFVGHGILAPTGELILALTDTDAADADVTGLEFTRIRAALIDSPARVKIVILDCCYSGRVIDILGSTDENLADYDYADVRGAYTLTVADRTAHAGQSNGCTSFTGQFLDLIRTGVPGGPSVLTFADLYPHLRRRLAASNLPTPNQRGTDTAGHYPVVRNRAARPNAQADPPAPGPPRPAPGQRTASSAHHTTRTASTPVRIERRVPWLDMIRVPVIICVAMTVALLIDLGVGMIRWSHWSSGASWWLGGSLLVTVLLVEILTWREYQASGPLVIDASGIRWDTGGHDCGIRWHSVQRVRLIGNGAGMRIIVWYQPGVTPPKPLRRGPDGSYLLLRPTWRYGQGPSQAVNERIRQALTTFAGAKYTK
jgi:hypothetical protein